MATGVGGGTRSGGDSSTGLPPKDGDGDVDSLGRGRYDTDNDADNTYGPPAGAEDSRSIITLIQRYYTAAAAGDVSTNCALLDPLVAEALIEQDGAPGRPRLRRDVTCATVLAGIFNERHRELVADAASLRVLWVQRDPYDSQAMTLVRFGSTRELLIRVRRTQGAWKMDVLLDSGPV